MYVLEGYTYDGEEELDEINVPLSRADSSF
jgi:hypothetical protein